MVLKRKRGNEYVPWTSSQEVSGAAGSSSASAAVPPVPDEPSSPKRTRRNPPRAKEVSQPAPVLPPTAPKKRGRPKKEAVAATTLNGVPIPQNIGGASSAQEEPAVVPPPAPAPKRGRKKAAAVATTPNGVPIPTATAPPPQATQTQPVAGPSSAPAPAPAAAAPAKKGRKKAAANDGPPPEKRQAVFKSACPQNILDRVARVMSQRIYMIDRNREGDELKETFSILGSTMNVYTVTIDHKPRCSCPDACRGNHCKHILFVFLKVLQVSRQSVYWYQKALLTSELETIFREAPAAPNSWAHAHIREAHARATGKAPSASQPVASQSKKRIPTEDDDCPICYDKMHEAPEAQLVFCEECGNALHKDCFGEWKKTAANQHKELTCVWCRAKWVVPFAAGAAGGKAAAAAAGAGARIDRMGYLNLADVGGGSTSRDTSTYYHGPRRGERYYGYNNYYDD